MSRQLFLALLIAGLVAGCSSKKNNGEADAETDVSEIDATADVDLDAEEEEDDYFAVTSCNPYHGPFVGGQEVTIRGRGFDDGIVVYFGEHMVQPADTTVEDTHRLTVVTPAGAPGPVDVRVVLGDDEAVREDAYTYDIFHVTPPAGSIAGGTYVTITGSAETTFDPTAEVLFDGRDATEVDVVSETSITCKTPPGTVGPANVTVTGTDPYAEYEVREAYTYYNHADPTSGGLGGGPIDGTVNVTVINNRTGDPVEDAFVMLGTDGGGDFQGRTNGLGQITFSGPDLMGRQTITAAKNIPPDEETGFPGEYYETTTIEEFDATDVTIILVWVPPSSPGSPDGPPPRYGAVVQGELVFSHAGEFGPGPWEIVPEPNENEEKIAFVSGSGWSIWYGPPDPTTGGVNNQVRDTEDYAGDYGYRFECFVKPEAVAVYALAGLRNVLTDEFTPYAFGIARNIIAGPGEYISGVYVYMTHELNSTLDIQMDNPPPLTPGGYQEPDTYMVEVFIDLGGDGVIWRDDHMQLNHTGDTDFLFPGWLPMESELSDATYTIKAGGYRETVDEMSGETIYVNPFSVRIESDVTNIWAPIVIDEFLGIPFQVDPDYADVMTDSTMEFGHDRTAPDFWLIMLQTYPDQIPIWKYILPGHMTTYTVPDLTAIAGLPELPSGYSVWVIWGIESPGFVYDSWSYRFLSNNYWSAYTADVFIFQFSEE